MKINRLLNPHIQKLFIYKVIQKLRKKKPNDNIVTFNLNEIEIRDLRLEIDLNKENHNLLKELSNYYLNHEFEILGSGYCSFNIKNLHQDISDYKNMNWNIDIKSGYEWPSHQKLNKKETFKVPEGVDIKYAWDFGRMNHLPQLAILYNNSYEKKYKEEIKNIVEDFYDNNEYLKGIQWTSPMDVGIRAINIILSYYIVNSNKTQKKPFNFDFRNLLKKTIYEHGIYIYENLEINFRTLDVGNHYLTNIVSLLYISYFIKSKETNKWWKFSEKEFNKLIKEQFSKDGTYYEGSTNYHRLATELLILGAAIIVRKNGEINSEILKTLIKAANFIDDLSFKSETVQIGDNDSGRIVKLTPLGKLINKKEAITKYINLEKNSSKQEHTIYFDEDMLNYEPTISMISGLIENEKSGLHSTSYSFEHDLIKAISGKKMNALVRKRKQKHKNKKSKIKHPQFSFIKKIKNSLITDNGKWILYENFGVLIYKTDKIFISLRLNGNRKRKAGHTHNDVFGLNIIIGNEFKMLDPGSFSYTSNSKNRKLFRSDEAHYVPIYTKKAVDMIGVFSMKSNVSKESLFLTENYCEYTCVFKGITHKRKIEIKNGIITIIDVSTNEFVVNYEGIPYYSNGYGKLIKKERKII